MGNTKKRRTSFWWLLGHGKISLTYTFIFGLGMVFILIGILLPVLTNDWQKIPIGISLFTAVLFIVAGTYFARSAAKNGKREYCVEQRAIKIGQETEDDAL